MPSLPGPLTHGLAGWRLQVPLPPPGGLPWQGYPDQDAQRLLQLRASLQQAVAAGGQLRIHLLLNFLSHFPMSAPLLFHSQLALVVRPLAAHPHADVAAAAAFLVWRWKGLVAEHMQELQRQAQEAQAPPARSHGLQGQARAPERSGAPARLGSAAGAAAAAAAAGENGDAEGDGGPRSPKRRRLSSMQPAGRGWAEPETSSQGDRSASEAASEQDGPAWLGLVRGTSGGVAPGRKLAGGRPAAALLARACALAAALRTQLHATRCAAASGQKLTGPCPGWSRRRHTPTAARRQARRAC